MIGWPTNLYGKDSAELTLTAPLRLERAEQLIEVFDAHAPARTE